MYHKYLVNGEVVLIEDQFKAVFESREWSVVVFDRKHGPIKYLKRGQRLFHREALGLTTQDKVIVDHINGDGLDNRSSNLRKTDRFGNQYNRPGNKEREGKPSTSKYKGVHLHKSGKWIAQIRAKGKCYYLGSFESEHFAALTYNLSAIKLHGEFAYLNEVQSCL